MPCVAQFEIPHTSTLDTKNIGFLSLKKLSSWFRPINAYKKCDEFN